MRVLVVIDQENTPSGRWSAAIPTVRGCSSWGPTLDEALTNVREALAACLFAEHGIDARVMAEDAELVETDAESFEHAVGQVRAAVEAVVPQQAETPVIRELAARLVADEDSDESVFDDFFNPDDSRRIADLLVETE